MIRAVDGTVSEVELVARCVARRAALLDALGDGILLLPTAAETLRNGDVHHAFRPGSDFWYLTGFPEPDALLAAWRERRGRGSVDRTVLFVRPRDREAEVWQGRRIGPAAARRRFAVDETRSITELWQRLPELLEPHARVFWTIGRRPDLDRRLFDLFARQAATKAHRRANRPAHPVLEDPTPRIAELRVVKDELELRTMARAAAVTAEAHVAAMRAARAGMTELEVQAILEEVFRRHGSRRNGYESIVASGNNACILHYTENTRVLRRGDLVLLDAGAEIDMYTADITRTWPVEGRFSEAQRAVYEVVLRAQRAALRAARVGRPWDAPHAAATRVIAQGLVELGVLKGTVRKIVADNAHKPWFMHGTSHWLGIDVHDAGRYVDAGGKAVRLAEGMVLTIEPGLYFDARDRSVPRALRGIGVRIEDDALVTAEGPRVLTEACPKSVRELEGVRAGALGA